MLSLSPFSALTCLCSLALFALRLTLSLLPFHVSLWLLPIEVILPQITLLALILRVHGHVAMRALYSRRVRCDRRAGALCFLDLYGAIL